jgi:FkbM family methyltransferase
MNPSRILLESGAHRLVRGRYGYVLYNKNDIVVGRFLEAYGEYFESEVAMFRQICRPGDIVVDAGANIGAHTLALSEMVGTWGAVFAFEAQRLVHQVLCANAALNSLTQAVCVHAASGAADGTLQLVDLDETVPQNIGGVAVEAISHPGGGRTSQFALDGFLSVSRLRFMKIDVEGMELEVLQGAERLLAEFAPVLYVENDRPAKSSALIQFLTSHGYRAYWHLAPDFNPENFFGNPQRIFAHGFVDRSGPYLDSIGFSMNLVCVPAKYNIPVNQLREVTDPEEHPMKREYNKLFVQEPNLSER